MLIEQLEDLTMIAAHKGVHAYGRERSRRMTTTGMEMTLEPSRVYTAGRRRGGESARCCPTCGDRFRMVSAFAATAIADISFRTLYGWAETGEVHFSATDEGALLICLDSLLERADALCEHPATASLMIV